MARAHSLSRMRSRDLRPEGSDKQQEEISFGLSKAQSLPRILTLSIGGSVQGGAMIADMGIWTKLSFNYFPQKGNLSMIENTSFLRCSNSDDDMPPVDFLARAHY